MARERARIGLAASKGDWPRRIAEYARTRETIRRMLLPTLLIISGVGGRLAELVDGELG